MGDLGEPKQRYLEMIDAAALQLAELLDELGVAARIEGDRYEPNRQPIDTLDLARDAAAELGEERVASRGRARASGSTSTRRSAASPLWLRQLCGTEDLEHVELRVDGADADDRPRDRFVGPRPAGSGAAGPRCSGRGAGHPGERRLGVTRR